MRKILSVVLAVVMLAAMFVMPINAADELGLVITEINVDTAYSGADGSSFRSGTDDVFEFVEVYNASSEAINLYDYSLAYAAKADATNFSAFTPIAGPEAMIALGVESGTICSSATNLELGNDCYYPVNPIEAVIQPGETAIIWLYTAEAYSVAALQGGHYYGTWGGATKGMGLKTYASTTGTELVDFTEAGVPVDFFRDYYEIDDDVVIVAVDANAVSSLEVVMNGITGNIRTGIVGYGEAASHYGPTSYGDARATKYAGPNGATKTANDLFAAKYPSADGRFQLDNAKAATVALVKSEKFVAADALKNVSVADAEAVATYAYSRNDAAVADFSNNYVADGAYMNHIATPGLLLNGQIKALATVGYVPVAAGVEEFDIDNVLDAADSEFALIYSEDFSATPAWMTGMTANYSATAANSASMDSRVSVANGVLNVDNNNAMRPIYIEIASAADMLADNGDNMYSNFVLTYDIKYNTSRSGSTAYSYTDVFAAVVYNFDRALSYDGFAVTLGGYGYNFNRHMGAYTTVDEDSAYYAGNKDEAGKPSIINKITNGKVLSAYKAADAYKAAEINDANRMNKIINDYVTVTVYFDWEKGATAYVNGCKVSEATDASQNAWSLAHGNFGLGIYADTSANVSIDNIAMYSCGDKDQAAVLDLVMNASSYGYYEGTEPATGDATLYVVVAMAVAFVALAAVVVIKRKKVND